MRRAPSREPPRERDEAGAENESVEREERDREHRLAGAIVAGGRREDDRNADGVGSEAVVLPSVEPLEPLGRAIPVGALDARELGVDPAGVLLVAARGVG